MLYTTLLGGVASHWAGQRDLQREGGRFLFGVGGGLDGVGSGVQAACDAGIGVVATVIVLVQHFNVVSVTANKLEECIYVGFQVYGYTRGLGQRESVVPGVGAFPPFRDAFGAPGSNQAGGGARQDAQAHYRRLLSTPVVCDIHAKILQVVRNIRIVR